MQHHIMCSAFKQTKEMENKEAPLLPISVWNTERVELWLNEIQLEKYLEIFRKATIDGPKLLQMSKQEFLKLGINDIRFWQES